MERFVTVTNPKMALYGLDLEVIKEGNVPVMPPYEYQLILCECGAGQRYWIRRINLMNSPRH